MEGHRTEYYTRKSAYAVQLPLTCDAQGPTLQSQPPARFRHHLSLCRRGSYSRRRTSVLRRGPKAATPRLHVAAAPRRHHLRSLRRDPAVAALRSCRRDLPVATLRSYRRDPAVAALRFRRRDLAVAALFSRRRNLHGAAQCPAAATPRRRPAFPSPRPSRRRFAFPPSPPPTFFAAATTPLPPCLHATATPPSPLPPLAAACIPPAACLPAVVTPRRHRLPAFPLPRPRLTPPPALPPAATSPPAARRRCLHRCRRSPSSLCCHAAATPRHRLPSPHRGHDPPSLSPGLETAATPELQASAESAFLLRRREYLVRKADHDAATYNYALASAGRDAHQAVIAQYEADMATHIPNRIAWSTADNRACTILLGALPDALMRRFQARELRASVIWTELQAMFEHRDISSVSILFQGYFSITLATYDGAVDYVGRMKEVADRLQARQAGLFEPLQIHRLLFDLTPDYKSRLHAFT
ncbi:unnamed protein product [Closterium sp. Naga37s-1]|nr:unnamed protein product [Closterium sp. Naga37s-1]